jgi:O-antigen ligase
MASLEGAFDIWNMLRVAWWIFFGLIAVLEINRLRAKLPSFINSLGLFPWFVGIWLFTLFASVINSPAPLYTFANAGLMSILVLAALDLGLKLYSGVIDVQRVLKICLGFSVLLLVIFTVAFVVAPEMVGKTTKAGLRARGGVVADNALLSQVVFFVGFYLASLARGLTNKMYKLTVMVSPVFLFVAQTRAMYVSFFLGLMIFLWNFLFVEQKRQSAKMIGILCIAVSGVMGLALYDEISGSSQFLAKVEEFLVRDRASIQSMNSRDGVTAILIDRVASQPWGLGYSAGPRHALLTVSIDELRQHGIYYYFAGNAHNMYLEVLGGSGVLGAAAWLMLLLWLLYRVWKVRSKDVIPVRVLLLVILIGGMTESYGALPLYQASSLLWILVAVIISFPREAIPSGMGV